MTTAWSWFLIGLLVLNIGGCVWLLWWTARRRPGDPAPTDTSHVWDGDVTEYNKPLPKWWINLFYITIVFAIGYVAWFPGFGNFAGFGNWSSHAEYDREKAAEDAKLARTLKPYDGQPIDRLATNPAAVALGRSIFSNTCATCHGSSASGAIGYPNLTDQIWHWGGTPDRVLQTVLDGREATMPAWGKVLTGMAGDNGVDYVVAYVRTLSHPETMANNYMAAQGKPLFESLCVGCHGPDGKGNPQVGAPDLTDNYWLYGDSAEQLHETIANGRHGVMPAHRALLGETRVRLVAAYVWSLSHKSATGVAASGRAAP